MDEIDSLRQFNEDIIQSMSSGLMVVENKTYKIRKFNQAMAQMSGILPEEAIGKTLEQVFVHIQGIPFVDFYNLIDQTGRVAKKKLTLVRNNEIIHRLVKVETFYDGNKNPQGLLVIVDDINEKEYIKESFGRYVTRQVVDKILDSKDGFYLKGIREKVTVLFADVRGFSLISENIEPEEVVDLLNKYFTIIVDIIFKYDGMLDKFVGDSVMAVFGAPIKINNHEEMACRAALEIQHELNLFNRHRIEQGEKSLYIGIGINSGEAVVGNIGSEKRMDYTVIGDTVNIANRMQMMSRGEEILITENTYQSIKNLVNVERLSPGIKSKNSNINIYALRGINN